MRPRSIAGLFVGFLLLAGCSKKNTSEIPEGVKIEFSIGPNPKKGPEKTVVRLTDKEGKPVRGASLSLVGTMDHPGCHASADAKETQPGVYEATLELTMGGDWNVEIQGKLADGRSLTHEVKVRGVKAE